MLPRARLGDDALLAHAFREQGLPERVVDLVRPRMQQVLALQINLRPATMLREPLRKIQLRRPPRELLQMMP